jgi:hypothetical protein
MLGLPKDNPSSTAPLGTVPLTQCQDCHSHRPLTTGRYYRYNISALLFSDYKSIPPTVNSKTLVLILIDFAGLKYYKKETFIKPVFNNKKA